MPSSTGDSHSGGGGGGGGGGGDSAQAYAASADFMRGFTTGIESEAKRHRVGVRFGTDGEAGGLAGFNAYQYAEAGHQLPQLRDGRPCTFLDGTKCSRMETEGTCPAAHHHVGTGSNGPGMAIDIWQPRVANAASRLRAADTSGGIHNGFGNGQQAAAHAAAAVAYFAQQQQQAQPQQQDPWAAHHRQDGGGGSH